ncbi:hypothetical protein SBD_0133 [Streptomyces bottropensis ATCC 25435]|uniref:Uncharacterized protein n=1 Tax=Streptomyces bottropensis ATCC 25435 TaxID=1054862 RepID=M3ELZ6_9ACTN|nr:hypothetical protein SBD_0133 [Streptomyces bottropensis ATCC 25435]
MSDADLDHGDRLVTGEGSHTPVQESPRARLGRDRRRRTQFWFP